MELFHVNEEQQLAIDLVKKFIASKKVFNMLLMGPAGTGKTTVVSHALAKSNCKVCFCAFTNKAVTVLQNASRKYQMHIDAHYCTIHSLLSLEPNEETDNLIFTFNTTRAQAVGQFDIIVIDECSTVSTELYKWLNTAINLCNKKIHIIYLGDYWQLPPVGEKRAIVFAEAKEKNWPIAKLTRVMRVNNEILGNINNNFITMTKNINQLFLPSTIKSFPYSLVPDYDNYIAANIVPGLFVQNWRSGIDDSIVITYSRDNCNKINTAVQDILNKTRKSKSPHLLDVGNRVCLERPVVVHSIIINERESELFEGSIGKIKIRVNFDLLPTAKISLPTSVKLYNGEIFEVVDAQAVTFILPEFTQKIHGHVVSIRRIGQNYLFTVPSISDDTWKYLSKMTLTKKDRRQILANLHKIFAVFEPGYCITLYKSQGSEWDTVYVNLTSIRWSILRNAELSQDELIQYFCACYTAISRASNRLYCF